jgi:hypothetical protein
MAGNLGAIGSGGEFKGFSATDFDAYDKKKWSSNAYTLERRNAKDKLLSLARAIASELSEDLGNLELGASEEAPSVANGRKVRAQWVFFTRDAATRKTLEPHLTKTDLMSGASLFDISVMHQHACLMMRLDHQGFAVGVEIASKAKVDRDNLAEKLKHEYPKQDLVSLCKELPGEATIGFEAEMASALDLTEAQAAKWAEELGSSDQPFIAQVLVPRDEEILAGEGLIGTASEYVSLFLPMFSFLAWSPTNDHKKVAAVIEEVKVAQKKAAPGLKAGDRVVMMSGLFAGRAGYIAEIEIEKGKAKVMVGPVSVSIDVKDLKAS